MTATAVSVRRPSPRWWADAGTLVAWASLLVVTALWLADGGLNEDLSTTLGRLTGLWASDLLLIQVLLMARIPVVERAFGQDRLARWHRWTGFTSFHLMLAHVVLITIGYTVSFNVFAELWELTVTYPGMLLAAAGTLLLVMVVVTSLRAARRRLRYESWHLLHLYAYLGAGLALPHQLWTGADFTASAPTRAYWWTLYGAAAGAVLLFRLGLPAWRTWRHRLTVDSVVPEGLGLTSVYLSGRHLDRLPVRAGQFFQWRFLDGPGWSRAHPYSLSATPRTGVVRITVKDLGDGSSRVAALKPGTKVLFEGPYGKLTGETYRGGQILMVACGIGITPLLALLGELPYEPGQATLVYRARNADEVAFRGELDWLAARRGVRVVYLLGRRGEAWLPAHTAFDLTPYVRSRVYVCGPEEWTRAVRADLAGAGVPEHRVHTEQFTW
jgi:predicted ferric reductase